MTTLKELNSANKTTALTWLKAWKKVNSLNNVQADRLIATYAERHNMRLQDVRHEHLVWFFIRRPAYADFLVSQP